MRESASMQWQFSPTLLPLGVAALGCLLVAVLAARRRPAPGVTAFAGLMLAATWWTITYGLELAAGDFQTKLLCAQIKLIGLQAIPLCGLALALQSLGQGECSPRAARSSWHRCRSSRSPSSSRTACMALSTAPPRWHRAGRSPSCA